MEKSKLIIIEGIPGSGKTSTARYVQDLLAGQGRPNHLYLEGDLDHPADYESTALLEPQEYQALLEQAGSARSLLEQHAMRKGQDVFIGYRKLAQAGCPEEICAGLARREIYDGIPPESFRRVTLERWQDFTAQALQGDTTHIFECCFIQNPVTALLAKHNLPEAQVIDFILSLAKAIAPLQPRLIYIDPGDVRRTLEKVAGERPPEWLQFVIGYITGRGYEKAKGLTGFDGIVDFYETMRRIGLEVFQRLSMQKLLLDHSQGDWEALHGQVRKFSI